MKNLGHIFAALCILSGVAVRLLEEQDTTLALAVTDSANSQGLIVFQSGRDGPFQICVMNTDGSNLPRLTDNSTHDGAPNWQTVGGDGN